MINLKNKQIITLINNKEAVVLEIKRSRILVKSNDKTFLIHVSDIKDYKKQNTNGLIELEPLI